MARSFADTKESDNMKPTNAMPPTHPGEILADELGARGVSAAEFAAETGMPAETVGAILDGRRPVREDAALRLSRFLGTTPDLWLSLQASFDARTARTESRIQAGGVRA